MARILVVEDEFVIAATVTDILEELGHTVVGPVASVKKGLAKIATEEIDVALLDVGLGNEDSFPIALELRQRKIPYAFATGYSQINEAEFAHDPTITKPYRFLDLVRMIDALQTGHVLQAT
jgi:DNA-binding response OmpR family regulator